MPGLELKLMPIPAGTFTMGSLESEAGRHKDEGPQTRVTLSKSFWLGQCEVTHGQRKALMKTDLLEQARSALADETPYAVEGIEKKKQSLRGRLRDKTEKDMEPQDLVFNADDQVPMY